MTFTDRRALALMLALPIFLAPGPTLSQDRTGLVIGVDGSGFMSGRLGGTARMDMAREALVDGLAQAPPNLLIGLMAYGNRTRFDRSDVDMLVPVDAAAVTLPAIVNASAKGDTSIGATLRGFAPRQAAEQLRYVHNTAKVVLLTHGTAICGTDPCAPERIGERQELDCTAHVVARGMTSADSTALDCLAKETGGLVFASNDADDLAQSLRQTILANDDPETQTTAETADLARALRETILATGESVPLATTDAEDLARALQETILTEGEASGLETVPEVTPPAPLEGGPGPAPLAILPGGPIGMFAEYPANPGETAAQAFDRVQTDGDLQWQLTGQCTSEPMVFYPDGLIASREQGESGHVTVTHEACTVEGARWSCLRREGPPEAQGAVADEYVLDFETGPAGMFALSLDGEPYVYQPCHGPHGLVFPDKAGPDGRLIWQSAMTRGDGGPVLVVTPEGVTLPDGTAVPAPAPSAVATTSTSLFPLGVFGTRRGSPLEDLDGGFRKMLDDTETRNALLIQCVMQPAVFYPDGLLVRRNVDDEVLGFEGRFAFDTLLHERCTADAGRLTCSRHDGPPEAGGPANSTAVLDLVEGPNRLFAITDGEVPHFYHPCHGQGGLVSVDAASQSGQIFWPLQVARGDGGPGIDIAPNGTVSAIPP